MSPLQYFDLKLFTEDPVLGKETEKEKAERRKKANKQKWLTFFMYLAVWCGVIGQKLMAVYQANHTVAFADVTTGDLLIALVIATVILPQVLPRVFAHMPNTARNIGSSGWRFVQFCTAFQQGFFWQALISLLTPK